MAKQVHGRAVVVMREGDAPPAVRSGGGCVRVGQCRMWRWPFAWPIAFRCSWRIVFAAWWPPCTPDGEALPREPQSPRSRRWIASSGPDRRCGCGDRPEHRRLLLRSGIGRRRCVRRSRARTASHRSMVPRPGSTARIARAAQAAARRRRRQSRSAGARRRARRADTPLRPVHGDAPGRADLLSRGEGESGAESLARIRARSSRPDPRAEFSAREVPVEDDGDGAGLYTRGDQNVGRRARVTSMDSPRPSLRSRVGPPPC